MMIRNMHEGRRIWAVLLPLSGALAVILAACTSSATPAPTSPPTIRPAAASQAIADSGAAMSNVNSFAFDLQVQGGDAPFPGFPEITMRAMSGQVLKSGAVSATIKAIIAGSPFDLQGISIGGKGYLSNPFTKQWLVYEGSSGSRAIFDPSIGITFLLQHLTSPVITDGGDVYHAAGLLAAQDARFLAGSVSLGTTLRARFDIGKADQLIHKATFQGRLTPDEDEGIVRTFTFSNFNQPFTITPPV